MPGSTNICPRPRTWQASSAAARRTSPSGGGSSSAPCSRRATSSPVGLPSWAVATPRPRSRWPTSRWWRHAWCRVASIPRASPSAPRPSSNTARDAQKERFVLPTLRGDITWCLGMSEPNAGSDLASLTTRAERRDGHFVVNGQKVWTSGAHDADFCLCFVRTDTGGAEAPGHQRAHHRHADAGHHVPSAPGADRPRGHRLQRGVLHRRGGARRRTCSVSSTTAGR